MLGALVERSSHLGAISGLGQLTRLPRDKPAVQPGRTLGPRLSLDGQVRSHCQCRALAATCVGEPPQLDNTPWRSIACCIEVGQAKVVDAPVHTIDNGIRRPSQLVIQATCDKLAYDWLGGTLSGDGPL
jgi:hypothetical protein